MATKITEIPSYRYTSKNCKYLDPQYKALAKRSFEQQRQIKSSYTFPSTIYEATRAPFLLGREKILNHLPYEQDEKFSLLEIGSGTGHNLKKLAQKFPKAQLTGADVSKRKIILTDKKLNSPTKKATLINAIYDKTMIDVLPKRPQVILFSYAFTQVNPHWKELVLQAKNDLTAIGYIAVIDFYNSPYSIFQNYLQTHNIHLNEPILPFLQDN